MSIFAKARVIFFLGYVAILLWLGFRKRMGFGSWHMFAGINRCWFDLRKVRSSSRKKCEFNPWAYLPHSHLAMNRRELDFFLCFLKEIKGLELNGEVRVREGIRTQILKVRDTYVVD